MSYRRIYNKTVLTETVEFAERIEIHVVLRSLRLYRSITNTTRTYFEGYLL